MSEEKELFTLRLSVEIANKLREIAMKKNISTTRYIVDVLKKELKIKLLS